MGYKHVGACPRCGAPIYESRKCDTPVPVGTVRGALGLDPEAGTPSAYFTCECRKALPEPLPDLEPDVLESTHTADRKTLAIARPHTQEPDSQERAE